MTVLWICVVFAAGWLASWYFGVALLARILRRPRTETSRKVIARMPQEQLVGLAGIVHTEILKRSGVMNGEEPAA